MRKGWLIRNLLGIPELSLRTIIAVFILACIVIFILKIGKK